MSDLEGLARKLMEKGYSDDQIIERLVQEYQDFKEITPEEAKRYARAVLEECQKSDIVQLPDTFIKELLDINKAGVSIGKQGVGCRGAGDFFVHKLIAELSETSSKAFLAPTSLDDAGAMRMQDIKNFDGKPFSIGDLIIVSKMEGIHSRLSDFPFICAFHVTRAALRDLYVKGAKPISIMIDIHLGDDADVGKLFDFMAGVSAVSELTGVPITAGSTLRIGGDMVIGDRITGGIGAVGVCNALLARRNIQVGDKILMTEGAGGGTITTTSLYSGNHQVMEETLNIKFIEACEVLLGSNYLEGIRAMCDVTNGGLRGDLYEINYEANCGVVIREERVRELVNPRVLDLLERNRVDYLGVSLDALLIYCDSETAEKIIKDLENKNIKCSEIGEVNDSGEVRIIFKGEAEEAIIPKFRESAYTKLKEEIGEQDPSDKIQMEKQVELAAQASLEKRKQVITYIRKHSEK